VGDGSDLGRTGETQLVQHSETSVELLLPSRLGAVTGDRLTSNVSNGDDLPLRGQIAAGKTGFLRARDRRGVPVLAVYEPVGYRDWGMIAKIDSAEADEPLWRLGRWTIIPAMIVLLLGAVGSYVLARHFTRPIQELADTAATVASGDLNARATVHTHDELEALAQRFNEMTEKLAESHATLEHQVEERTAELNRSNRELEQFAYVASHDLQEPLRAVAGYCQLLKRRYIEKLDGDAREFLEYAVDGAERMRALIDGLLDYSRVQTQGRPFADVDCESVLDWALRNLEASLVESGAQVTRSAMPVLFGDDGQLARLMQNLIGNAIKYRGEKPPEIRIEAQERDDEWVISVADNGIGIDPKHFDRVFAIFQRLHTREEYPGTGIGLAVCKRIVERHNGRMWVESEVGRGSVFFFTIPQVTNSQETEPST
jgi:signal transduction histidine kinase